MGKDEAPETIDNPWACTQCTFFNETSPKKGEICGTLKGAKAVPPFPSSVEEVESEKAARAQLAIERKEERERLLEEQVGNLVEGRSGSGRVRAPSSLPLTASLALGSGVIEAGKYVS
jgi:hypothetical protein